MISEEERRELIAYRMQQAEEAIVVAEGCIRNGWLGIATNRIYYGMFYAMLALGLLRHFETSKHQQMIGWFNKNFVHTGIFPSHFSGMVKDAFQVRSNSDYKVREKPSLPRLEKLLANRKIFINAIKAWLAEHPT